MILKNSKNTVLYASIIIFILSIAEMMVFTHHSLYKSGFLTWVYFLSGILIAVIPLFKYQKVTLSYNVYHFEVVRKVFLYVGYAFFFVLLYQFVYIIESYRLEYREADMLPSIRILAQRALSGQKVYAPLTEINRPEVLYAPGFWLPYTIPILLKIDIRWTSFFFFMLGIGFLWYQSSKEKTHIIAQALFYLMISLACYFYFFHVFTDLRFTQEPLIIGYYLFLGYLLLQKETKYQWIGIGLIIGLCLLSRFSFLLWVPFYMVYLWKYQGIKKAIQVSSVIGLLVLILFIVPFGIEGIKKFAGLPTFQANQMAERFAEAPREKELGMAKFFSSKDGWFIYDLQRGFSLLIMILGIIAVLISPKWIEKAWLPISFLKLTLVFFCNFLQIPYPYLFGPSTFLSLIMVIGFIQQKTEWKENTSEQSGFLWIDFFTQRKAMLMILFCLPPVVYGIKKHNYLSNKYDVYQKSGIVVYEQNFDHLADEPYWTKTVPMDTVIAHTGKYSNKVGLNNPYSCTFRIPVKYIADKECKGVRFSVWAKSNKFQSEVSKMTIAVSYGEKTILYREKNISPQFFRDNKWRKHIFATEIPEGIMKKANTGQEEYILSAFVQHFDNSNYIYIDDMSVEFF